LGSVLLWAVLLPALAAAAAWSSYGLSLPLLAGAYGWQWRRIIQRRLRAGWSRSDARLYAAFALIGKFAALIGAARFFTRAMLNRPRDVIDHKIPDAAAPCAEPR
jgi:hypothetical protein